MVSMESLEMTLRIKESMLKNILGIPGKITNSASLM